jgi:hypothetical protein
LEVGATFGGIDFLVLTSAVYVGWIFSTAPPRRHRALWAAAAIVVGHLACLAAIAYSDSLSAALPNVVAPPESDTNAVGIWTWGNGLRTMIPWNMPLLMLLVHGAIVAVMARSASWLPIVELDPRELKRLKEKEAKEEIPGSVLAADAMFRCGPAILSFAAVLLVSLAFSSADLKGKKIVAYEKGFVDWNKPTYDSQDNGLFGMLPVFVESLGGKFILSKNLAPDDFTSANVLLLLHPNQPWDEKTLGRIRQFVEGGGSLLLAADPAICDGNSSSRFNEVLEPLAMRVRFDTAVARAGSWEQSCETFNHPAVMGIDDLRNRFGLKRGSSIALN